MRKQMGSSNHSCYNHDNMQILLGQGLMFLFTFCLQINSYPFPFMIDLQALLHRKGSGDVSTQENEAVVHILIVEVNTYHKQRKRNENLFRLLQ